MPPAGWPFIAHPWGRGREHVLPPEVLARLAAEHGLEGIEVDHQDHDPETRTRLRALAGELGLLVTGSSDYHGTGKLDHELGCNTTDPAVLAALLDRVGAPTYLMAGAVVVAVANQKGGVAKTTTVASLGAAWTAAGHRVLVVDLDPQACLTFSLGYDPESIETSVHEVLLGEAKARAAVLPTDEGVDLLPATIELAAAELLLLTRPGREQLLKTALEPVLAAYDFVLIDCPPTLGILTTLALTAAQHVLIPLQCETLSHRGVGQLLDTVYDVKKATNRRLAVLGVLPTLYDGRSAHARLVLDRIGADYGVAVLEPPIPRSVRFAEAPAVGRTLVGAGRTSKGAEAYRAVAATLAARLRPAWRAGLSRIGRPGPPRSARRRRSPARSRPPG